jgi:Fe-coproporphyrin III synthase
MTPIRSLRERVNRWARATPFVRRASARLRRFRHERRVSHLAADRSGRAGRLPHGIVFEPTMRCNLRCGFCYVGDLLNAKGEWQRELTLDRLRQSFPKRAGLLINLTGGEVFVRQDILDVMELFRQKGYACGYLTTNGTLIDESRADGLADLAVKGFLKHISISVDGPPGLHDLARGVPGTFDRMAEGLRRVQAAARTRGAPLRFSINTTVSKESLDTLDELAPVARGLGVDSIGLNHLMFSTPEEAAETARLVGASDPSVISTFVTPDPGMAPDDVRRKVTSLEERCRHEGLRFDARPKVVPRLFDRYYTPGAVLAGRCFYPFMNARIAFDGKAYFCPFIRVEVGDLTKSSLAEIWSSEVYLGLRRRLLEHGLFPVCRRCCKVELSARG